MPSTNREGAAAPSEAGELIDGPDTQDCSKHPGGWGSTNVRSMSIFGMEIKVRMITQRKHVCPISYKCTD